MAYRTVLNLFVFSQKTDTTYCRMEKNNSNKKKTKQISFQLDKFKNILQRLLEKGKKNSQLAFRASGPEELFYKVFSLLFCILVHKEDTIKSAA